MIAGQALPEPAEILRLAIILATLPPAAYMLKRLPRRPGQSLLVASYLAIVATHTLAVLEDLVPFRPAVDMVQHLGYGVAGVLALAATIAMLRASAESGRP